ncbi:hypothetical protein JCM5296_003385 [Sporobolomyces johnsonii]
MQPPGPAHRERDDSLAPPPSYASIASPLLPPHSAALAHASSSAAPPPVSSHPAFQHAYAHLHLPSGFFLLRNRAQGKALDLLGHKTHEGAEIGLHPIKQPQLKGLNLQHNGNNQVFFLSWDGHLLSAAASRAVDAVGNRLSLAHPHPIAAFPSASSHPLPRFRLDPETATLHVLFSTDPSYPDPHASSSPNSLESDYIVEAVPLKRRKRDGDGLAVLGDLGIKAGGVLSGFGGAFEGLLGDKLGLFGGGGSKSPGLPSSARSRDRGEASLPPPPPPPAKDSVTSSSRPGPASSPPRPHDTAPNASDVDSESDSEPTAFRPVRLVRLPHHWREKFPAAALRSASSSSSFGASPYWPSSAEALGDKALRTWRRRQWDVVPVTVQPVPPREDWTVANPSRSRSRNQDEESESEYEYDDDDDDDDDEESGSESDARGLPPLPPRPSDSTSSLPFAGSHPRLSESPASRWSTTPLAATAQSAASTLGGFWSSTFAPRGPGPKFPGDPGEEDVEADADADADAEVVRREEIDELGRTHERTLHGRNGVDEGGVRQAVEIEEGEGKGKGREAPREGGGLEQDQDEGLEEAVAVLDSSPVPSLDYTLSSLPSPALAQVAVAEEEQEGEGQPDKTALSSL